MADSNAVRQANKRERDAEYRLLRALDHPEQVNELLTNLIHEADQADWP